MKRTYWEIFKVFFEYITSVFSWFLKRGKKSLAQEVRQMNDIAERYATRPTVSLCDLSGVILHQK